MEFDVRREDDAFPLGACRLAGRGSGGAERGAGSRAARRAGAAASIDRAPAPLGRSDSSARDDRERGSPGRSRPRRGCRGADAPRPAGPPRTERRYSSAVSVGRRRLDGSASSLISSSSSGSSRRRISASGRCSAWSRRITRSRARCPASYGLPGPDLPGRGQESLGDVVADGPRRDAGKVGQLGQAVAFVVGHGRIVTVLRRTVKTLPDHRPPCRLHTAPHPGQDARHTRSTGTPITHKESQHMRRIIAAILLVVVLVIGGGVIATTGLPGRSQHRGHDLPRQRHRRHPGRRPRLRLRLGLGWHASASGSSASSRPCSSCSSSSACSARSSGAAARAGAAAGVRGWGGPDGPGHGPGPLWETRGTTRPSTNGTADAHGEATQPADRSERRRPGADRHRRPGAVPPPSRALGRLVRGRIPLYDATDEDHPRRRRRTEDRQLARDYLEHAGFAVLTRRRRTVGADARPPAAARSRRPRPRPARARRPRRHARAAPRLDDPDRDADRPRRRARQAPRARARRRRLPDQAVQPARARRPGPGRPPRAERTRRRGRRDDPRPATSSSTCRGCGPRSPAGRRADPDRVPAPRDAGARSPGRIFTRSQLLDALHGVAFESYERAIDSHIKNLRRKLEPDPRQPRYVLTVYGVGYRFADDREPAD